MAKNRVIVLIPRLDNPGGVANYYTSIKPYLGNDAIFLNRGKDRGKNIISRLIEDYYQYIKSVNSHDDVRGVVINHSLGPGSFYRDGLYSLFSLRKVKNIIYFHGWNLSFEKIIGESFFRKKWLEKTFLKADHIIVLSSEFKRKLIEWGYQGPISVETTLVDEQLIKDETWEEISKQRDGIEQPTLLYLGNVSKAKGVWEIVNSLNNLSRRLNDQGIRLKIAGSGEELHSLKNYVKEKEMNVEFLGYVKGAQKAMAFQKAHLYVFPSKHGEGMPLSVLEAMAFGLPVLTTHVGGIPDFFEDGKMGLFLDSREPQHIAEKVCYLLDRPELMRQISKYNFEYAKEHFYASKVAKRLEAIIDQVTKR